ncbi:hypothetical protein BBK36DRAFT_1163396 [Trichoderma citrinoviride]|uniref:H-type lectin domain-containing protein n=1 Tax=Trichoderma citrinoviride TaxID=58853 RepID=A0A2T4AYC8_9HYPO|nr:hypothetical protein BBK36DRAFT_1163396 [Trichoderma citrinoviride]PTB62067.1 hypothetical protein BBK36DRAFT_1163396 [Trichoderma citrinoviride]
MACALALQLEVQEADEGSNSLSFNSYTQQICIDDAVVIDPDRIDNAVTNDGFTMRELRYGIGARAKAARAVNGDVDDEDEDEDEDNLQPQPQLIEAIPTVAALTGVDASNGQTQSLIGPAPPSVLDSMALQLSQDVKTVAKLVEDIARLESAIEEAVDPDSAETKRDALLLEKKRMRLARLKTNGTGLKTANPRSAARELSKRGPSQIVSYSSRFVNKISEITDDMNISGSLSIKYGAIGGSGKGSFVDSDKFKESDLNFFISVKVVNQSINIKDALVFQGLPSVNETNFRSVFGDCFISGFLEGGEFNALVSMKVVNKDKRMAVKAEAEVALSVGAADIKANAHVDIAKSNFSSQTETTIQVGWSGGGHIKPVDQLWTIQTLMETAAKFPDLVANTPQRTYAILTKYESLRSYMALKPPKLKPMFYENAAIYTNALLDAYMDYKNIYRTLGTQLFDIQASTKKFVGWPDDVTKFADSTTLSLIDDETPFEATIKGLDLARRACRFQMVKIVKEVDTIEEHPDYAADEKRPEAIQSTIIFRDRLPAVKDKEKVPFSEIFGTEAPCPLLERVEGDGVTEAEAAKAASYGVDQPDVGKFQKLAPMVGSPQGTLFCNLDFVKADFSLRTVTVDVNDGVVIGLSVRYTNGLLAAVGTAGGRRSTLTVHHEDGEKIIACSIETGRLKGVEKAPTRVTALRLYTNRGPDLLGNSEDWKPAVKGEGLRDGKQFEQLELKHFDPLLVNAQIKGFWGYGTTTPQINSTSGIFRLGPIWGNKESTAATVGIPDEEPIDTAKIMTNTEARYWSGYEHKGWRGSVAGRCATFADTFARPLPIVPTVIYGFRVIDVANINAPRLALSLPSVSETGYTLSAKSFLHGTVNLEASVMVLPHGKVAFQNGYVDASDNPGGRTANQNAKVSVTFSQPFKEPPKVCVWFTEISQPRTRRYLRTYVDDVTPDGMTVHIDTWDNSEFEAARVGWLAWPAECDGKLVKAGNSSFAKGSGPQEAPWYGGSFSKDPKVFTGINYIDFPMDPNSPVPLPIFGKHEWATKDKLRWHGGTWGDTIMTQMGFCWIAME